MDRRKYLKTLAASTAGLGLLFHACKPEDAAKTAPPKAPVNYDRTPVEQEREQKLFTEQFFDAHEMKTITILVDIIIPKDETSGSASDAGVHDFIEFIAKDMPRYQIPLRGGLKWLDVQCMKQFNADFASLNATQQVQIIDQIAYPEQAKPEMQQGVAFFNTMRDLTACGFFSSKIGIADIGYKGNTPNSWDGVPADVLEQYGVKYEEHRLDSYVKHT
ncbi:gluconate 2-dehydrogenase subunit 3 family protein [Pseudochryseolinea flava]|uniref:Gluconate 2-dehydrogenase subunit 3 family protein n=1 Tax=Pseudochryseolinea flava TaxID=2059302 RepID=A0A364XYH8_9BACT|nr:gluconate 2-dehydrogenase subunit 3 family protein [Pseudochryseolinea flava]RAV98633.1 gluconate 2-dehydrogenase subunit 3 family protein [Pseudochryseolinea flava]